MKRILAFALVLCALVALPASAATWETFLTFKPTNVGLKNLLKIGNSSEVTYASDDADDWKAILESGESVDSAVSAYCVKKYRFDAKVATSKGDAADPHFALIVGAVVRDTKSSSLDDVLWKLTVNGDEDTITLKYDDAQIDKENVRVAVVVDSSYITSISDFDGMKTYLKGIEVGDKCSEVTSVSLDSSYAALAYAKMGAKVKNLTLNGITTLRTLDLSTAEKLTMLKVTDCGQTQGSTSPGKNRGTVDEPITRYDGNYTKVAFYNAGEGDLVSADFSGSALNSGTFGYQGEYDFENCVGLKELNLSEVEFGSQSYGRKATNESVYIPAAMESLEILNVSNSTNLECVSKV